jgi:outer membrane beta-barrel protein
MRAVTGGALMGLLLHAGAARADEATPPAAPPVAVAPESAAAPHSDFPNAPMQVGQKRIELTGKSGNVVRSGPGDAYAIVGVYPAKLSFPVIAKSDDWYGVKLSETETGWVHASLCRVQDDLSGLQFRPNPKVYTRTGSYVVSGYSGAYAFDRKSNSAVVGGRLGYYVFDRIVAEAGVSWTRVHRPAEIVESLFGLSLEAENFSMLFYQMNVTWELMPGRQMVPYVGGGVGSAVMLGRSEPSVNFGAGTKLFLSKRAAMRWEVRDYHFRPRNDSSHLAANNIEFTLGSEILF